MSWLLGRGGRAALRRFVGPGALVALDFDGTLAPIVGARRDAAMRPATLALLAAVARRLPTVVISGRARADVTARLRGAPLRGVVGNHGAEPAPDAATARRWRGEARRWAATLRRATAAWPGVEVEAKGAGVTLHYRRAARPAAMGRRLARLAAALEGARVTAGKRVVNVTPADAPHKGTALARTVNQLRATCVLFVGDDDTDEDAFAQPLPVPAVMVRVGAAGRSRAAFHLRGQLEVDRLLELLAALPVPAPASPGPRLRPRPARASRPP